MLFMRGYSHGVIHSYNKTITIRLFLLLFTWLFTWLFILAIHNYYCLTNHCSSGKEPLHQKQPLQQVKGTTASEMNHSNTYFDCKEPLHRITEPLLPFADISGRDVCVPRPRSKFFFKTDFSSTTFLFSP